MMGNNFADGLMFGVLLLMEIANIDVNCLLYIVIFGEVEREQKVPISKLKTLLDIRQFNRISWFTNSLALHGSCFLTSYTDQKCRQIFLTVKFADQISSFPLRPRVCMKSWYPSDS
jgi:hypothetical protein